MSDQRSLIARKSPDREQLRRKSLDRIRFCESSIWPDDLLLAFGPDDLDIEATGDILLQIYAGASEPGTTPAPIDAVARRATLILLRCYCKHCEEMALSLADGPFAPSEADIHRARILGTNPFSNEMCYSPGTNQLYSHVCEWCRRLGWQLPTLPEFTEIRTSQQAVSFVRAVEAWIQSKEQELSDAFDSPRYQSNLRQTVAEPSEDSSKARECQPRKPVPLMRRLSNGWRFDWQDDVGCEGNEVDNLKGFDYIAQLIRTPHVSVPTVRLLGIESDPVALSDQHSLQPTWDSATLCEVRETEANLTAKLERLNKECLEAQGEGDDAAYRDSDAVRETTKSELVELRREKGKAIKPNGQPRELNKPNAKQHESVRMAIRRAVTHLEKKQLKRLALHFGDFAKADGTGTGYVYCPDPMVTWNVEATTPTG